VLAAPDRGSWALRAVGVIYWRAVRINRYLLVGFVVMCSSLAAGGGHLIATSVPPSEPTVDTTEESLPPPTEPALRLELLEMAALDQAVRTGIAPPGDDRTADELFAIWDAVDAANSARMAEILDEYGWPGFRLVGRDGASAAWLLIQHADLTPDLQERGLLLMTVAVEEGDADSGDWAYLVDRVLVANGEPQVYGTQWELTEAGEWTPRTPIEDEANVDARRASVGLGTLDDYLAELDAAFDEPLETTAASSP
jgi:hypothetical protein